MASTNQEMDMQSQSTENTLEMDMQSQSKKNTLPVAGTVARVQMINFMCHDNLELSLNPRANIICGSNGSGKSAIQTAITVGLGGKALSTNRGHSVKALIKHGKNTSHITVVLNNMGPMAYRPEQYGDLIQVERTFSHTSTQGYKIKNAQGNVVSTEKKELETIIDHFNIQIENPVCILHQDVARNFLSASDPKQMFSFFMKATRFSTINQTYQQCDLRLESTKDDLQSKKQNVEEAFKDVQDMKRKLKTMEDTKEKALHCEYLKKELIWAKVRDAEIELRRLNKMLERETLLKRRTEEKMSEIDEKSLKEKLRELEQNTSEVDGQAVNTREKIGEARNNMRSTNDRFADKMHEYTECKNRQTLTQDQYNNCLEFIEGLVKNSTEKKIHQEKCKAEIAELQRQLEQLRGAMQTMENDWRQLHNTVEKNQLSLNDKQTELTDLQRRRSKKEDQMKEMSLSTNSLAKYGNVTVKIVDEIDKADAQHRFLKKPIGPIGKHVEVRDPTWTFAVECFLGKGVLSAFCVDNKKDLATLSKLMETVCKQHGARQPAIYCSKFLNKRHDIRSVETGTSKHPSLAQMLTIDNDEVFNVLVDHQEIESVLLIETNDEAYDLLDEDDKVPQFCNRAFTKTGDEFVPSPNYKSYSNMKPRNYATLLNTNQCDLTRHMMTEIQQLKKDEILAEQERRRAEEQLAATHVAVRNNELEQQNVKTRKINVTMKLHELNAEIECEAETNLGYLDQEAEELKTKLDTDTARLEKLKEEVEELREEARSATEAYEALQKEIAACDEAKVSLMMKIHRMKIQIRDASAKKDFMRRNIAEHDGKLADIEARVTKHTEELTKTDQNAGQVCDRIHTERTIQDIERELNNTKAYLEQIEAKSGGTSTVLEAGIKAREQAFDAINKDFQDITSGIANSRNAMRFRRKSLGVMHQIMIKILKTHFAILLNERNYQGKIEVDFRNSTLELHISERNSSNSSKTSMLSGGEKSFATVCFIMALWRVINLPFHFLDEFDVFMDEINRRTILDLLISYSKENSDQYVFLTPLDISSQKACDTLSIHRLENPRG